jgi:hypothetical protein
MVAGGSDGSVHSFWMNIGDSAATTLGTCSSGSMKSVGLKG